MEIMVGIVSAALLLAIADMAGRSLDRAKRARAVRDERPPDIDTYGDV